jgi:hypothetical protein
MVAALFSFLWMMVVSPPPSANIASRFHHVIIDVENVRGQTGFQITHEHLFESLSVWRKQQPIMQGTRMMTTMESETKYNLTLVMDHGDVAETYHLFDQQFTVMFSGKYAKADDIIALDLLPKISSKRVLIVTADSRLIQRCRRISNLEVMAPLKLIDELDKVYPLRNTVVLSNQYAASAEDNYTSPASSISSSGLIPDAELQIALRVLAWESKVRVRCTKRQRKDLRSRISQYWKQLSTTSQDIVLDVLDHAYNNNSNSRNRRDGHGFRQLTTSEQQLLLSQCRPLKNPVREGTNDRVIRAEQIRLQFQQQQLKENIPSLSTTPIINQESTPSLPLASSMTTTAIQSFAPEAKMTHETGPQSGTPLTLVVISDTHGMEDQLVDDKTIPPGDVLLHLGDFAKEHRAKSSCDTLDTWLANFPHPLKFVIRGNHDPRYGAFPKSQATYITNPTIQFIADYKFCFAPYISGGLRRKKCLPKSCDVLVSHVPPKKVLDQCWPSGLYAGSETLLRGVQKMTGGLPIVWLCGHIHEGRGIRKIHLGKQLQQHPPTVIINASNANAGRAKSIDYGPVVLQLGTKKPHRNRSKTKERRKLQILQMDGRYVYKNIHNPLFFPSITEHKSRSLLMAVDLGLRTGVCLFNSAGELLCYEYFHFESVSELQMGAKILLKEWENDANKNTDISKDDDRWQVSHVAIEGTDPPLAKAWKQAVHEIEQPIAVLFVKPEEWREDILTEEERSSGTCSKLASTQIALRVISRYGRKTSDVLECQTDVAESILLGLYMSCRLGWINDDFKYISLSKSKVVAQDEE